MRAITYLHRVEQSLTQNLEYRILYQKRYKGWGRVKGLMTNLGKHVINPQKNLIRIRIIILQEFRRVHPKK